MKVGPLRLELNGPLDARNRRRRVTPAMLQYSEEIPGSGERRVLIEDLAGKRFADRHSPGAIFGDRRLINGPNIDHSVSTLGGDKFLHGKTASMGHRARAV